MRDDLDPLFDYAEARSGPLPDYLIRLERETYLKTLSPQMISGRLQGRLLALLSKLLRPRRVLEVGTFTGYATLCLAEGLHPEGRITTIEGNPEVGWIARKYFAESPFPDHYFDYRSSKADTVIDNLKPQDRFDLIFLDADKRRYATYYERLLPHLNPGGLFLSDNVLWDGRVIDPTDTEPDVRALAAYNQRLATDPRVELLILPLRDGLSVARKRV